MFDLQPPRHISTLHSRDRQSHRRKVRLLRRCGQKMRYRQRHQISKAREIAIGSDLLLAMRRYLAVDSIFVWPKSTRTASISPVPFKMWRAFVRRKDSEPYFV